MRKLAWIIGIIAVLWSAYWAAGTWALHKGVTQAFATAAQQGKTASYETLRLRGFPVAFDARFTDLDLGDPTTGQRWRTSALQLRATTWQPWHVDLSLAADNYFTFGDQQLNLFATSATVSVTSAPDATLPLTQLSAATTSLILDSSLGWEGAVEHGTFTLTSTPDTPATYDLALNAANIHLDPAFIAATGLADTISLVTATGSITLTAPLDRYAGQNQPALAAFAITAGTVTWGDLALDVTGTVAPDAAGFAEGRLMFTIKGWRAIIPALVAAGVITPQIAPTFENLLRAMASDGGDPETLRVPLTFAGGRSNLGPLPLGPAPMLAPKPLN